VVIGADVEDVYDAVARRLEASGAGGAGGGDKGAGASDAEPRERPTTAVGWVKYGFSELIGVITG
ncbi:MAG: hypothetical protein L0J31_06320, partial [Corynebacterium sp.]|nr:hypothetical protein [Corynebacterium sp.]